MSIFTIDTQAAMVDHLDEAIARAEDEGDRFVLVEGSRKVTFTYERSERLLHYVNARILRAIRQ